MVYYSQNLLGVLNGYIISSIDEIKDRWYYIRQEKDINKPNLGQSINIMDINKDKMDLSDRSSLQDKPFISRSEVFIHAHKKTEKLASAIYLVTNLLSDHEPMKWSLRKKSSELASLMILYKDIPESGLFDYIQRVRTSVLELVSMLEISSLGGLISPMNFSVLKQEFSNLITMFNISHEDIKGGAGSPLPRDFFNVTEKEKNTNFTKNISLESNKVSEISPPRILKDTQVLNAELPSKSNRQNIIINLLRRKKELTIKDIAQVVKDCSEKTIQRELISLISMGAIRKTGERRWSKYSLVT
ncbi:MAG: hypothetical protein WAX44_01030 [Minisyncoccia bacterium]